MPAAVRIEIKTYDNIHGWKGESNGVRLYADLEAVKADLAAEYARVRDKTILEYPFEPLDSWKAVSAVPVRVPEKTGIPAEMQRQGSITTDTKTDPDLYRKIMSFVTIGPAVAIDFTQTAAEPAPPEPQGREDAHVVRLRPLSRNPPAP